MKYLDLDQNTLEIIDDVFNSKFSYFQFNEIDEPPEIKNIFQWSNDFNSEDIKIMLEDLKKEIHLEFYIPKQYLISPIKFLNYIMKKIQSLNNYYLNPYQTKGIFRTYYLKDRY